MSYRRVYGEDKQSKIVLLCTLTLNHVCSTHSPIPQWPLALQSWSWGSMTSVKEASNLWFPKKYAKSTYELTNSVTTCFAGERCTVNCQKGSHKVRNYYICQKQTLFLVHLGENNLQTEYLQEDEYIYLN